MTDYSGIIEGIARLIDKTIRSRRMCDIFTGKVVSASPLIISADGHELTDDFLVNAAGVLLPGDSVVVIRKTGGQKYYVIAISQTEVTT